MNINSLRRISAISMATITTFTALSTSIRTPVYAETTTINIPQLMSLFSTLEGYSFIFGGLSENGINLNSLGTKPNLVNLRYSFSESGSTLVSSGIVDNQAFSLNYSGTLSGDYPNEDMSWVGTWSGSLGSSIIQATDTATFLFNPALGGYDGLDFRQSGSLTNDVQSLNSLFSLKGWIIAGSEAIGGGIVGALATCWTGIGCFPGIVGGSSIALGVSGVVVTVNGDEPTPKPKPPIDDPNPDHKTEVGSNGKAKTTLKLKQPNGGILEITTDQKCEITCDADGTVRRISIPEPSDLFGLFTIGTLGTVSILKRKLKPSKSTEKEMTKVS